MRQVVLLSLALFSASCALDEDATLIDEQQALATSYVGCYVDRLGPDTYLAGYCALSARYPTTASFKLFTTDSPTSVSWDIYDGYGNPVSATCNGLVCTTPIGFGQTIHASAIYVVNGTPTTGGHAIAEYEYEPPRGP